MKNRSSTKKSSNKKESVVKNMYEEEQQHHFSQQLSGNPRPKLAREIEEDLKNLISNSCFSLDVVEVDVIDNIAYIFIDGEDSALLIGKEGYRYNALSYMLFNWLYMRYKLFIKLEIAEFLASQTEMVKNYMRPVIEQVNQEGAARTRPLDGILVQIALEILREEFPHKYVTVKTNQFGKKFVMVSEFNSNEDVYGR
jgi:spoIIIJ-associated protein